MLERLQLGLLSGGHILLEGVPGLAKTLAIKSLSQAVDGKFSRIQFTPDLLPADVIGTMIYNPKNMEFLVKRGPIFANFVLADEINRSPAKVQSALLEAMQEKQVTIGEETHYLEEPFLVLATQNPIEQEGTYPLPEAQVDRFMLKCVIDYPKKEEERLIMRQNVSNESYTIKPVVSLSDILDARKTVREVYMDEKIEQYILDIVFATRAPKDGQTQPDELPDQLRRLSPRLHQPGPGGQGFCSLSNGVAMSSPEDVRAVCQDVLRHRIGLTYEAEAEDVTAEEIINKILDTVEVP
jgi:MoxR-like ATPase